MCTVFWICFGFLKRLWLSGSAYGFLEVSWVFNIALGFLKVFWVFWKCFSFFVSVFRVLEMFLDIWNCLILFS